MVYVQKERVTNMARPRKYTFPLSDLEGFEKIRLELESNPELDGFDIENAVITLKQRKQSYTAQPENLKRAIVSLERYISRNGIIEPVELSKREMSDILCISRPTVNKWIDAKIIESEIPETTNEKLKRLDYYPKIFTTRSILQGMKKLVDKL